METSVFVGAIEERELIDEDVRERLGLVGLVVGVEGTMFGCFDRISVFLGVRRHIRAQSLGLPP